MATTITSEDVKPVKHSECVVDFLRETLGMALKHSLSLQPKMHAQWCWKRNRSLLGVFLLLTPFLTALRSVVVIYQGVLWFVEIVPRTLLQMCTSAKYFAGQMEKSMLLNYDKTTWLWALIIGCGGLGRKPHSVTPVPVVQCTLNQWSWHEAWNQWRLKQHGLNSGNQ